MPTSICAGAQLLEHRRGLVLIELQLEPRQRLADLARHARQQIRPDRRQQRHAQLSCERIAMRARQRDHFIARFEDAPRARHDLLARLRQRDLLGLRAR